ncbi:hypothetical protein RJ639_023043 [Escallonia herrerae]|uniref:Uncharacterized protein n=1 Tax=Escallonia herrerae TaxID=1293975 RepID=A0AA88V0W7_9ASTE|nr:hypothetical protein RJ639_023043 [Escallonia herrerae]
MHEERGGRVKPAGDLDVLDHQNPCLLLAVVEGGGVASTATMRAPANVSTTEIDMEIVYFMLRFKLCLQKRYTTDHPLAKNHIFERLDNMWRCWRYELKQKYFVEGDRAKSLRNLNDPRVDKSQWEVLVNYWLTDEAKYIKDGKIRSRTEMYIVSRTHKDGTVLEFAKGKLVNTNTAKPKFTNHNSHFTTTTLKNLTHDRSLFPADTLASIALHRLSRLRRKLVAPSAAPANTTLQLFLFPVWFRLFLRLLLGCSTEAHSLPCFVSAVSPAVLLLRLSPNFSLSSLFAARLLFPVCCSAAPFQIQARDLLLVDQAGDRTSLWFVSKRTGVVGVFNSQGTGWCKVKKKTRIHDVSPSTLTCSVQATDVDVIAQVAEPDWNGGTVFYSQRSGN